MSCREAWPSTSGRRRVVVGCGRRPDRCSAGRGRRSGRCLAAACAPRRRRRSASSVARRVCSRSSVTDFLLSLHAALHRMSRYKTAAAPKSSLFRDRSKATSASSLRRCNCSRVLGSLRERLGESLRGVPGRLPRTRRCAASSSRGPARSPRTGPSSSRSRSTRTSRAARPRSGSSGCSACCRPRRRAVRGRARRPLSARACSCSSRSSGPCFMAAAAVVALRGRAAWLVYALAQASRSCATRVPPAAVRDAPAAREDAEELTASNVVLTTIESVGVFIGPALGGLLLAATSTETSSPRPRSHSSAVGAARRRGSASRRPERERRGQLHARFFGGFGVIANDRKLALIVPCSGQTLVAGALNVLIVVTALELLDLGEAGVGFLNSAVGIGGLLGALAAAALVGRQRLASDFGVRPRALGHPDRADRHLSPRAAARAAPARHRGGREHGRRRRRAHAAPAGGPGRGAGPRVRRDRERLASATSGSARSSRRC